MIWNDCNDYLLVRISDDYKIKSPHVSTFFRLVLTHFPAHHIYKRWSLKLLFIQHGSNQIFYCIHTCCCCHRTCRPSSSATSSATNAPSSWDTPISTAIKTPSRFTSAASTDPVSMSMIISEFVTDISHPILLNAPPALREGTWVYVQCSILDLSLINRTRCSTYYQCWVVVPVSICSMINFGFVTDISHSILYLLEHRRPREYLFNDHWQFRVCHWYITLDVAQLSTC